MYIHFLFDLPRPRGSVVFKAEIPGIDLWKRNFKFNQRVYTHENEYKVFFFIGAYTFLSFKFRFSRVHSLRSFIHS